MRNLSTRNVSARNGSRKRPWLAAMGGLLAVMVIVGGSTSARAEDDDDSIEERIIKDILGGMGVNVGRQSSIDYHERSPLVIPPSRELPPPETTGSVVNNPAWPVNPESRKKKASSVAVNDNRSVAAGGYKRDDLSAAEMQKGATANAGRVTTPNPNDNLDPGRALRPAEMGESSPNWFSSFGFNSILGYKNSEQVPFKGEPPRTSLIQPPEGYQTPSAQYPYGINPDNKKAFTAPNPMDRGSDSGK